VLPCRGAAAGGVAFGGYLTDIEAAYGWGAMTPSLRLISSGDHCIPAASIGAVHLRP